MLTQKTVTTVVIVASLFMFSACARLFGDRLMLMPKSYEQLPGWSQDHHQEALAAFLRSCDKFHATPDEKPLLNAPRAVGGRAGDWRVICAQGRELLGQSDEVARNFFEYHFAPYVMTNWGKTSGLFTGYYQASLKGSRTCKEGYQCPLYAKPNDIKEGKPYFSREEIENGALAGKGLELVWLDDPVEAFFLQIQGSGVVQLDDGSKMQVGYAGKNGHAYTALGRYMIAQGWMTKEQVTAQSIKQWLYSHPDQMKQVMNQNASYVFFREITGDGPIGLQGVALTPLRSLAVDKNRIPMGVPVWLNVPINGRQNTIDNAALQRLMVAQDTGGAIRGAVRGDIFFGAGEEAEQLAGVQNSRGEYYMLLPKGIAP